MTIGHGSFALRARNGLAGHEFAAISVEFMLTVRADSKYRQSIIIGTRFVGHLQLQCHERGLFFLV